MATHPLLRMAAGQTATDETKPESAKTRGRKPGRGPNQRKQPQRGLGVAQLERLRLQERWNRITGIPNTQSFNQLPDPQRQSRTPMVPLPFTDQAVSVPVQYGAPVLYGAPSRPVGNSCGGLMVGNGGGFGGLCYGGSSGMGGTLVMMDQVGMDPYGRAGDPDPRLLVGTVLEASKELSSMPKMLSGSQHCDVCFKKKRGNGGNIGHNGGRDMYTDQISPINGSDFLGSYLQNIPNFTGHETGNFGARAANRGGRNLNEGTVEVVAVHRKGSNCSRGKAGIVLMEYEFFPEKSGTCSEEGFEFPTEASVAEGSEASYLPTTTYISTSSSVDLSLKLSY